MKRLDMPPSRRILDMQIKCAHKLLLPLNLETAIAYPSDKSKSCNMMLMSLICIFCERYTPSRGYRQLHETFCSGTPTKGCCRDEDC
eukprot:3478865-Amphidinium_carterae.2